MPPRLCSKKVNKMPPSSTPQFVPIESESSQDENLSEASQDSSVDIKSPKCIRKIERRKILSHQKGSVEDWYPRHVS